MMAGLFKTRAKMVNVVILIIASLFLFFPMIAQEEVSQTEKSTYSQIIGILKLIGIGGISGAILGAIFGGIVNSILAKKRDKQQSRSLIIAFLAESVYNFSRCVLYHGQKAYGEVSKSSLFELTDAGALSRLATVTDNPEVISSIAEVKSNYYQMKRYTDVIAPQIAERNELKSQVSSLREKIGRAGGDAKKKMAIEAESLSSRVDSLDRAISEAQGTALAFFNYENAAGYIKVLLREAKGLMADSQVVVRLENDFLNNCSAKEYIDQKNKEAPDPRSREWGEWSKSVREEFERIRKQVRD